jgi:hypothetical protein
VDETGSGLCSNGELRNIGVESWVLLPVLLVQITCF